MSGPKRRVVRLRPNTPSSLVFLTLTHLTSLIFLTLIARRWRDAPGAATVTVSVSARSARP